MGHIPPITGYLITLFLGGLPFIILYRRKDGSKHGIPEIFTLLEKNPGCSLQQIADELGLSRSTIRYYVRKMQKKENSIISATSYFGHLYYFAVGKSYTQIQRLTHIILLQEKEELALTVIWEHPGITKRGELTDHLRLTRSTCDWYLQRFFDEGLMSKSFDGMCNHYQLTDEATDACNNILAEWAKIALSDQ